MAQIEPEGCLENDVFNKEPATPLYSDFPNQKSESYEITTTNVYYQNENTNTCTFNMPKMEFVEFHSDNSPRKYQTEDQKKT